MVDNLDQTERVDRELNVVKRARFNQTIETHKTNEVPEPKFGVEPHTVKELPALPVRERRQNNMLLHQQIQDNMVDEEVVSFGQRAQHQQDQQQLQLGQHNIPHNPVYPKQLDDVIKVVNTQAADIYHLDQSIQDIQQELVMLRQTVDSWNDEQQMMKLKRSSRKLLPKKNCLIFLYMKIKDYLMILLQDLIVPRQWQDQVQLLFCHH